jgi:hypothetical protein
MAAEKMLDFSDCTIVTPPKLGKLEQKAVTVLQEEIQKRTGIKPSTTAGWPGGPKPLIVVCLQSELEQISVPFLYDIKNITIPGSEGFCVDMHACLFTLVPIDR